MEEPTGYNINIDGEFDSAGMSGWVAVPVTNGEHFVLFTDDGDLVCEVTNVGDGYYVIDGDATTLFHDWRAAMLQAATDSGKYPDDLEDIKRTIDAR